MGFEMMNEKFMNHFKTNIKGDTYICVYVCIYKCMSYGNYSFRKLTFCPTLGFEANILFADNSPANILSADISSANILSADILSVPQKPQSALVI